jgi:predicted enzyme related to lactoylglutathione lyase
MDFKMSNFIAVHTDNREEAVDYYQSVFGIGVKERDRNAHYLDADPFTMCIVESPTRTIAHEFIVSDLKKAEEWLTSNGCKIIERYPDGRSRYFQDRYGLVFHLWEKKN